MDTSGGKHIEIDMKSQKSRKRDVFYEDYCRYNISNNIIVLQVRVVAYDNYILGGQDRVAVKASAS